MSTIARVKYGQGSHIRPCASARVSKCASMSCRIRSREPYTRGSCLVAKAEDTDAEPKEYNRQFGYSRKDVLLIGVGLVGLGYAMYYGFQATGMEAGMAGNVTQLLIFVGLCIGWIGSYVFRVANKDMTYVKQLKEYEEAVMKKRLEELTDTEVERMLGEVDKEREGKR